MNTRELCYKLNKQIDKLAEEFVKKYFWGDPELKITLYRVEDKSDDLSYNLYINEYYFPLDVIYTALCYDIDGDILFDWYAQWSDFRNKNKLNLKNFLKMKE